MEPLRADLDKCVSFVVFIFSGMLTRISDRFKVWGTKPTARTLWQSKCGVDFVSFSPALSLVRLSSWNSHLNSPPYPWPVNFIISGSLHKPVAFLFFSPVYFASDGLYFYFTHYRPFPLFIFVTLTVLIFFWGVLL